MNRADARTVVTIIVAAGHDDARALLYAFVRAFPEFRDEAQRAYADVFGSGLFDAPPSAR